MTDYNKIKKYDLELIMNEEGYLKFTKTFIDNQLGIQKTFTENEFHQAIEHRKAVLKKTIDESNLPNDKKEKQKNSIDSIFSIIEEKLKNEYFIRIQ